MLANTQAGRGLINTPYIASCTAGRVPIKEFVPACSAAVAACADESLRDALTDYVILASRLAAVPGRGLGLFMRI
jgi:hypothetical protein